MPPIYDANNEVMTPAVESALSKPDVISIKNKTLDGQPHYQVIGTAGTVVEVVAHFTAAQKLIFDAAKKIGALITVVFDGFYYTGVIDEDPSYNRIVSTIGIYFTINFNLLVTEEGVA